MSSEDAESLKATINAIINEKKQKGTWDPYHWQITIALIAALRLPDISVADQLKGQGAELSPRSLLSFVNKGSAKLLRFVIREIQKAGTWWPDDWYTGLALAEAWFFERKKLYAVFAENDVVFMPEWLVTAVKYGDIGLIVKIVHGLKATERWEASNPFILKAISEAIKEEANIWYYGLLQEGATPNPHHLITAVRRGDCNILRDIIQNLKAQSIWNSSQSTRDTMLALEEACLKKDITAYTTLIEEGAEPDFHCLLTAVKSDYYQLAARIVRDLKLCGKWNDKVVENDWSLALARDYISSLPNGARQTWENLLFGPGRREALKRKEVRYLAEKSHENTDVKQVFEVCILDQYDCSERKSNEDITTAPPNTPVGQHNDDANKVDQSNEENGEDDIEIYPYEEPSDETLYRNLQRSVSAPVAETEYPTKKRGMTGVICRKRHSTEPGDCIHSESEKMIFSPSTFDERIAKPPTNEIANGADQVDKNNRNDTNGMYYIDREQEISDPWAEDTTADVHSVKTEPILSTRQILSLQVNGIGESTAPCRTPGVLDQRLSSSPSRLVSRYLGVSHCHGYNNLEVLRLRSQFSFSIRSIPLTVSYADHLRYITKLKF